MQLVCLSAGLTLPPCSPPPHPFLPLTLQVFTRLALAALPHELGNYVVDCGESISLAGELRISGPSLGAMAADLALAPGDVPRGRGDITTFARVS